MVLTFFCLMKDLKMRFYKKTVYEDNEIGKQFSSVNKLSEVLQVSQPYIHKVMSNQIVVTEKQYYKFQKQIQNYLNSQTFQNQDKKL